MNEATGLLEAVDLHKLRQNKYLELKQKYTGTNSRIAVLAKKEAENI